MREYTLEDVTVRPTKYDDINDIFTQEKIDDALIDELLTTISEAYKREQLLFSKAQKLLDGDKSCNKH